MGFMMTNTVILNGNTYVKESKFCENIKNAIKIIPILKRADDLFMSIQDKFSAAEFYHEVSMESTINSEMETYHVGITRDKSIRIDASYIGDNGYTFSRSIFRLDYQNIDSSTNIDICTFSYSPLHDSFTIGGNVNYKVLKPFEHDEAWYFQKLTLHELLPESLYIHGSELMKSLNNIQSNFVYAWVNITFNDEELKNITELLDLLESQYA